MDPDDCLKVVFICFVVAYCGLWCLVVCFVVFCSVLWWFVVFSVKCLSNRIFGQMMDPDDCLKVVFICFVVAYCGLWCFVVDCGVFCGVL